MAALVIEEFNINRESLLIIPEGDSTYEDRKRNEIVRNGYSIVAAGLDFCTCCRSWASGSLGQIGSQLNNELFCTSGTVWLLYVYPKVLS